MQRERKEKSFVKKPIYEGGANAMRAFVKKHLKYPKEAFNNKIEGTVYLKYTIDYQGNVIDTHIISGLGHGCDEEAERIVKMLKFKVPKNRKIKVTFHKNIQIHFRLPKRKVIPEKSQISYTIVPSQKEKEKAPKRSSGKSHSYTISY
ncbi:MAG: energy transducer TonB [Saprospiraceae bacterium]|nr:energy transducer TonB [Saprospiraceae bacterium]